MNDAYEVFHRLARAAKRLMATEQRIADLEVERQADENAVAAAHAEAIAIFRVNPSVSAVHISERTMAYFDGETIEILQGYSVFSLKTPESDSSTSVPSSDEIVDQIFADAVTDFDPTSCDELAFTTKADA